MRIASTPYPYCTVYVGFSDMVTLEEMDKYGILSLKLASIANNRAKQLGGRKYRGKAYGTGYVFPNYSSEQQFRIDAEKMFPQLF